MEQARSDWPWINGDGGDGETTYTTNDYVIAVLDSGIRQDHAAFNGPLVNGQNSKFVALYDFVHADGIPEEETNINCLQYGHGTGVAAIAAGRQWTNNGVNYRGVAPGARLVIAKIGECNTGYLNHTISALQWIVGLKQAGHKIVAVNYSYGSGTCDPSSLTDPYPAVQQAFINTWNAGILPITAAGNSGPDPCTVDAMKTINEMLVVGNMHKPDST